MMPSPMHAEPSFWSPGIAALEPYVPGEQPQGGTFVKLNTNENPYPPSPRVKAALVEAVTDRLITDDAMDRKTLISLAARLQAIGGGKIASATYPGNGRVVGGAAVLIPDTAAAEPIVAPFR